MAADCPGGPAKWRYDLEPFRAKEFWPQRRFIRDQDDGWETEGSDAEGVGKEIAAVHGSQSIVDVAQGVKRSRVGTEKQESGTDGAKRSKPGGQSTTMGTEREERVAAPLPDHTRKLAARPKTRKAVAVGVANKPGGASSIPVRERIKNLADKAKAAAKQSGAGVR